MSNLNQYRLFQIHHLFLLLNHILDILSILFCSLRYLLFKWCARWESNPQTTDPKSALYTSSSTSALNWFWNPDLNRENWLTRPAFYHYNYSRLFWQAGFEPTTSLPVEDTLPLSYCQNWCRHMESNHEPRRVLGYSQLSSPHYSMTAYFIPGQVCIIWEAYRVVCCSDIAQGIFEWPESLCVFIEGTLYLSRLCCSLLTKQFSIDQNLANCT